MIDARFRSKYKGVINTKLIRKKLSRLNIESVRHGAAAIRKAARKSIKRRKSESLPGQPPHTRLGQLKKSILYSVDRNRESAVIGASVRLISRVGMIHETGGTYTIQPRKPNWKLEIGGHGPIYWRGGVLRFAKLETRKQVRRAKRIGNAYKRTLKAKRSRFPKRPFMLPALQEVEPRLPSYWRTGIAS